MFRQLKRLRAQCQIRHLQLAASHLLWLGGGATNPSDSSGSSASQTKPPSKEASKAKVGGGGGGEATGPSAQPPPQKREEDGAEKPAGQTQLLHTEKTTVTGTGDKSQQSRREVDAETAAFWSLLRSEMEKTLQDCKKEGEMEVDGLEKEKVRNTLDLSLFFSPRISALLRRGARTPSEDIHPPQGPSRLSLIVSACLLFCREKLSLSQDPYV